MSDTFDDTYDPDAEPVDETEPAEPAASGGGAFGRSYEDLPEGFVTAGGFAKIVKERRGQDVRPQVFYATAKNSKTFPAFHHTDGRIIVNIESALEWWDEKEKRNEGKTGGARSSEPTAFEKAQASGGSEVATEEATE